MVSERYTTRDLEPATWTDFADLFGRGAGWDFCACMYFLRGRQAAPAKSRSVRTEQNLTAHHDLLAAGRALGVLVYDGASPVGWCQYARPENVPVGGGKSQLGPTGADWRITCFVTDKAHRRTGVAATALRGVLAAVRRRGGGLVEGYPVAVLDRADRATAEKFAQLRAWKRERSQIIREGRWAQQARWDAHMAAKPAFEVKVEGVGAVAAWDRPDQQLINCGTVGMFEAAGFSAVGVRKVGGETRVVMQKRLDGAGA